MCGVYLLARKPDDPLPQRELGGCPILEGPPLLPCEVERGRQPDRGDARGFRS